MKSSLSISFLGAGALASGLARRLCERGVRVPEVLSRPAVESRRRAAALAREVGAVPGTMATAALACDVLLLAVPDAAIAGTAKSLARRFARRAMRPRVVLHASGARDSSALAPLSALGIATGSAHPMMTFVAAGPPPDLRGAYFALEGAPAAVRAGRSIARLLGALSFVLSPEKKPMYHAFGAMLSPMLAAELEAAANLGRRAGISPRVLRALMRPIVERTVANVLAEGAAHSFSGPLVRGDVDTVKAHLLALAHLPEAKVYRALVAYATQTLPVARRAAMKRLLLGREIGDRPQ